MKLYMMTYFFLVVLMPQTSAGMDIPEIVEKAFHAKFPEASAVNWEEYGDNYIATFFEDNAFTEAIFDQNGSWVKTERSTDEEALSQEIIDQIETKYDFLEYLDVVFTETPENSTITVKISSEDDEEMTVATVFTFDHQGQLLSLTEED